MWGERGVWMRAVAACVAAFAGVGGLVLIGHEVLVAALNLQACDAHVINIAGRQRMLSQRLAKAALAASLHPSPAVRRGYAEEMIETIEGLARAHRALKHGDAALGLPGRNSAIVQRRLERLDHDVARLAAATHALLADLRDGSVEHATTNRLLAAETGFVRRMDRVVRGVERMAVTTHSRAGFLPGMERVLRLYERDSADHVAALAWRQSLFVGLTLGILSIVTIGSGWRHVRRRIAYEAQLRREVMEASLREQRRIGQDLHDGLGQQLAGAAFVTKVVTQRLEALALPEAREAARVGRLLDGAIRQTRDLAFALTPPAGADLEGALRGLGTYAESVFGISCRVRATPVGTDAGAALHLFRIAQEAVTNAVRHGKAHHVDIDLVERDGNGTLSVTDDGAGFEPDAAPSGLGLRIMHDRARMIGGRLAIESAVGRGTRLSSTFPSQVECV